MYISIYNFIVFLFLNARIYIYIHLYFIFFTDLHFTPSTMDLIFIIVFQLFMVVVCDREFEEIHLTSEQKKLLRKQ